MKRKALAAVLAAVMTVSVFGTSYVANAAPVNTVQAKAMGNPYDQPIMINEISCNYGHNAVVGQHLQLGIDACEAAVKYSFYATKDNGNEKTEIYTGKNNSCTFVPTEPGDYWIEMSAYHLNGTAMTNDYEIKVTNDGTEITTPLNLKATKTDWDTATLTWDAATTNKGNIAGYEVYCNGNPIAFSKTTSADVSLIKGDNDFTVAAVTDNDIYSAQSAKANAFRYYCDLSLAKITSSTDNYTVGTPVKFTVEAKAHSNLKYKFVVYGPNNRLVGVGTDLASNVFTFVPQEAGGYEVHAYAYTNDTWPGETMGEQGDSVVETNFIYFTAK